MERKETPVSIFYFVILNSEVGSDRSLINKLQGKAKDGGMGNP